MSLHQFFIQFIAVVALGLFAFSFYRKTRKEILFFQLVSEAGWFLHFYLLSAWTGAILIFLNAIIIVFFLYKDSKKWIDNYIFLTITCIALLLATILTWQGFFSIFALLSLLSNTFAKWQKGPDLIRKISILASLFWICYDFFVGSYGGILAESIIIISIIFSLLYSKRNYKFVGH